MLRTRSAAPYREVTPSTQNPTQRMLAGVTDDLSTMVARVSIRRVRINDVPTWITSCKVCGHVEFAESWDAALLNGIDHKIQLDAHRRVG